MKWVIVKARPTCYCNISKIPYYMSKWYRCMKVSKEKMKDIIWQLYDHSQLIKLAFSSLHRHWYCVTYLFIYFKKTRLFKLFSSFPMTCTIHCTIYISFHTKSCELICLMKMRVRVFTRHFSLKDLINIRKQFKRLNDLITIIKD